MATADLWVSESWVRTVRALIELYGMDWADASTITEYAEAEGSHAIPGSNGKILRFSGGKWSVR